MTQKWIIPLAQIILLAQDDKTRFKSVHLRQKYLQKKFPITPPEKGLVVLGMEALFNNKFATSKSLMAAEKLAAEKR